MTESDIERRIALLEERFGDQKERIGRLVSHLESERDLSRERGLRVMAIEKITEVLDKILRNGGQGLVMKVDRMERLIESKRDSNRNLFTTIISILSAVIALISLYHNIK